MNEMVKSVVVLTVISVVVAASLGGVHQVTKPLIDQARIEQRDAAMRDVLAQGKTFEELDDIGVERVTGAFRADGDAGYVFTISGRGYKKDLNVMVGVTPDGVVTGTKLMENNETPGLGSKVGNTSYSSQYTNITEADLDQVDRIVGATRSSDGYKRCVEIALQALSQVTGGADGASQGSMDLESMQEVFPSATEFQLLDSSGMENIVTAAKASDNSGYVFKAQADGFAGTVNVLVGMDSSGQITGVKLMENDETEGYGKRTAEPEYTERYVGKTEATLGEVDVLAGASVTSNAFKECVKSAIAALEQAKVAPNAPAQGNAELDAMKEVFPSAADFELFDSAEMENIVTAAKASDGSGYVFKAQADGFAGTINVMVGIDSSGQITGVKLMENDETEGYGKRTGEPEYTERYVGKTAATLGEVDVLAGASVTSKAFAECVQSAIAAFESQEVA